jgi:hypothetical protein
VEQPQHDTQPNEKSLQMNVLIAEFNAVREEIIYRATSQGTLMQINITAAGAVASFALVNYAYAPMLIIIPILSPVLGVLWLDHDASIMKLGNYIRHRLKADYERVAPFNYPDYQRYVELSPTTRADIFNFSTAVAVTFGFLPFIALLYVSYVSFVTYRRDYVLFGTFLAPAILAVLLLLMFFFRFAKRFWFSSFTQFAGDHDKHPN